MSFGCGVWTRCSARQRSLTSRQLGIFLRHGRQPDYSQGRLPSGLMFFLGSDHNVMLSLLKDPNLLFFSGHGRWSDYSSRPAVVWAIVFGVWGTDMTLGPSKEPKLLSSRLRRKKKSGHGRRSDYSQQRAAVRAIVFFLGFGAWTRCLVRRRRLTSPHLARANFCGARRPVFDYLMMGRRQGYCLLCSGHGCNAWSVNESKAHFILLGHLFWGTDASLTILNNGPP